MAEKELIMYGGPQIFSPRPTPSLAKVYRPVGQYVTPSKYVYLTALSLPPTLESRGVSPTSIHTRAQYEKKASSFRAGGYEHIA